MHDSDLQIALGATALSCARQILMTPAFIGQEIELLGRVAKVLQRQCTSTLTDGAAVDLCCSLSHLKVEFAYACHTCHSATIVIDWVMGELANGSACGNLYTTTGLLITAGLAQ